MKESSIRHKGTLSFGFAILFSLSLAAEAGGVSHSKKTYIYKRVADCSIRADVYRPDDQRVRPVILWIHGGALSTGRRDSIEIHQLGNYLEAGLVVVSVDYRLAPETKLPDILKDVQDAYSWIRSKGPELFHIDPDRIAVVGHSAGGYLTLTTGYRFQPRPRALVSFYGYGDIIGDWYSRPDPFYSQEPFPKSRPIRRWVAKPFLSHPAGGNEGSSISIADSRGSGPRKSPVMIPTLNPEPLTGSARSVIFLRTIHPHCFFTGTKTPTCLSSSPNRWLKS